MTEFCLFVAGPVNCAVFGLAGPRDSADHDHPHSCGARSVAPARRRWHPDHPLRSGETQLETVLALYSKP
jgi:hypothetical protein